jgi:hypothetical protein
VLIPANNHCLFTYLHKVEATKENENIDSTGLAASDAVARFRGKTQDGIHFLIHIIIT